LFYLIIKLIKYFFFVFLEKDAESVVKLTDELYALLLKERITQQIPKLKQEMFTLPRAPEFLVGFVLPNL
jgi:uncharacterized membrane protein (Fun14 family)